LVKYGNNPEGLPALHAAIKARDEKAVRMFLDHGADPNAKSCSWLKDDVEPRSALDFAAAFGNISLVNLLIDRGATINPIFDEESGTTPLICAARFNNADTLQCLIKRGSNLYYENHIGNALHVAALYHCVRVA